MREMEREEKDGNRGEKDGERRGVRERSEE